MIELYTCPFCGGKAETRKVSKGYGGGKITDTFQTICTRCGVKTPYHESSIWQDGDGKVHIDKNGAEEAATAWNRREPIKIHGNKVDLCRTCEKNYERCDAYDGEYLFGDTDNICCCKRYEPVLGEAVGPT